MSGSGRAGHAVAVLAKRPAPGRVKTRLSPPLTPEQAAAVAAAALQDTIAAVSAAAVRRRVLVFDGDPVGWQPAGWGCVAQVGGGLDRRIAAALAQGDGPTVVVGMDTPQLAPALLCAPDLDGFDACLGLAADGGYWALGLAQPALAGRAVHDVPMSTPSTGERQLRRLQELGLRVQLLPELTDVDTAATAAEVAAAAPGTRFARVWRDAVDCGAEPRPRGER